MVSLFKSLLFWFRKGFKSLQGALICTWSLYVHLYSWKPIEGIIPEFDRCFNTCKLLATLAIWGFRCLEFQWAGIQPTIVSLLDHHIIILHDVKKSNTASLILFRRYQSIHSESCQNIRDPWMYLAIYILCSTLKPTPLPTCILLSVCCPSRC